MKKLKLIKFIPCIPLIILFGYFATNCSTDVTITSSSWEYIKQEVGKYVVKHRKNIAKISYGLKCGFTHNEYYQDLGYVKEFYFQSYTGNVQRGDGYFFSHVNWFDENDESHYGIYLNGLNGTNIEYPLDFVRSKYLEDGSEMFYLRFKNIAWYEITGNEDSCWYLTSDNDFPIIPNLHVHYIG